MCASFHPTSDLVLSASLDQCIRIWDISGLRKKAEKPKEDLASKLPQMGAEILGNTDATVKHVLEGHDRGVNWASFHKKFPLIVSGADDRQVKLWRMSDVKAWEIDTLRGHLGNVSCAIFHPREELIISNSEDKTIRVWDISKRSGVHTHKREHDRFWILAAHPELNSIAAGHDSGLMVFKLERERPAYFAHADTIFYVKDRQVKLFEFGKQRETPLMTISRQAVGRPRTLHYNPAENAILLYFQAEGGRYELYKMSKDAKPDAIIEPKKGRCLGAVFVGRNRYAVLETNNRLSIRSFENDSSKLVSIPSLNYNFIFPVGSNEVLLRTDEKVYLVDTYQQTVIAELSSPPVKYVFWTNDNSHVALISKHVLIIANRQLEQQCSIHEPIRIKSGAWDESGVFVYNTLNHIKYCLPNGDHGIIRTLEIPLYITKVHGDVIQCLDRDGQNKSIFVDSAEFAFKASLHKRDFAAVKQIIQASRISGNAIIGYLQKKGFPEVALHFVKDERTRFNLALQCGKIDIAKECAGAANDKECWERLGEEALKQGRLSIVEEAYQRTESFERLSFLYLITGQIDKLQQMLQIARSRGDVNSIFHNALYLGDVEERVKVLTESGQLPLAYLTAVSHNLSSHAEKLSAKLSELQQPQLAIPESGNPILFTPSVPLTSVGDWPLLNVTPDIFDTITVESQSGPSAGIRNATAGIEENSSLWNTDDLGLSDDLLAGGDLSGNISQLEQATGEVGSGWEEVEIVIPEEEIASAVNSSSGPAFIPPRSVPGREGRWVDRSHFPCHHAAAGNFESAMTLLHLQIGAVSFNAFKESFLNLWLSSHSSLSPGSLTPSLILALEQPTISDERRKIFPPASLTLAVLVETLKSAYAAFSKGALPQALEFFRSILVHIPLLYPLESELSEVQRLLTECREYILLIKIETARRASTDNPVRAAELAAYSTHCSLQPPHMIFPLQFAMSNTFKIENFIDAGMFAKKLLEKSPRQELAQQARQVHLTCEKKQTNKHNLAYDMRNPFVICGSTLTPIYRGTPFEQCPYCKTYYTTSQKGNLCQVCEISQIGITASGLFTQSSF
eukprot:c21715_g1_i3.p1 GENE.c21715_g1_i3~~c21715_g1_i3.p1  ORF type:complete len:1077 (-),score=472.35 c21715_g1_i3:10-3240(-)